MAKIGQPRVRLPSAAAPGEVIEVKTLVSYVNETGNRRDADGTLVPRDIIKRFEARFEGTLVFAMDCFPSISANPFISFLFQADAGGTFEFTWINDADERVSVKSELTVA
jgi:sulfur-oxidizing protein SoxZ